MAEQVGRNLEVVLCKRAFLNNYKNYLKLRSRLFEAVISLVIISAKMTFFLFFSFLTSIIKFPMLEIVHKIYCLQRNTHCCCFYLALKCRLVSIKLPLWQQPLVETHLCSTVGFFFSSGRLGVVTACSFTICCLLCHNGGLDME